MTLKHISVAETAERLNEPTMVVADIRDIDSFNAGHIPGAVHLSNANLAQFMTEQEYDAPIVVVCYHGISSQGAANYLIQQGFEDVYSMDGGFEGWKLSQFDNIERS